MSKFEVNSSSGTYSVVVSQGAVNEAPESHVYVVDPVISGATTFVNNNLITVVGSENSKTLSACEEVLVQLKKYGTTKSDHVTAIGGGVVQDVATLVTSLYMRGIAWTYAPTTLMSMADSCIGGKSSINAGGIKNLVGNFYPPRTILVDTAFIPSLSREAIVSGLSEAVKICYARGGEAFLKYIESPSRTLPGDDVETANLITHTLESKKWFIEIDEFDQKERKLLNFGHSFGHAWEAACKFSIPHGVGIAVGVLAATNHPASAKNELTAALRTYCLELLRSVKPLIQTATINTDWQVFKDALKSDKKNSREFMRLILPIGNDSVQLVEFNLDDTNLEIATNAIKQALLEV